MAKPRRVVFKFDDRSCDSLDDLKRQGYRFKDIVLKDPKTGATRKFYLPIENKR